MKHGFLKVAAATPDIRVADVEFNTAKICEAISEACEQKAKIIVFPELCVTGYTCGDLFTQDVLLKAAKDALVKIAEYTADKDILVFAGAPLSVGGKLYNVAAAMNQGRVIGLTHFSPIMRNSTRCASLRPVRTPRDISISTDRKCHSDRSFCLRQVRWRT